MNDAVRPGSRPSAQVRCPSCSEQVNLPADSCPKCHHSFRPSSKPSGEELGGSPSLAEAWIVGSVVLAAILALAFFFLFQSSDQPMAKSAPALPPTAGAVPSSELGEALVSFDSLPETEQAGQAPAGQNGAASSSVEETGSGQAAQ